MLRPSKRLHLQDLLFEWLFILVSVLIRGLILTVAFNLTIRPWTEVRVDWYAGVAMVVLLTELRSVVVRGKDA